MDGPRPTYTATVTREDGLWVAVVAEINPAATDVEHFNEIKPAVRDLIGGLTDKDPESGDFRVNWIFLHNGHDYSAAIEQLEAAEFEADRAVAHRDVFRRAAIKTMQRAGLSLRDIADVMGMSHQRVHQLTTESRGFNATEAHAMAVMNPDLTDFEVGMVMARFDLSTGLNALSRSLDRPEVTEALHSMWSDAPIEDLVKAVRASLAGAALKVSAPHDGPYIDLYLFPPPNTEQQEPESGQRNTPSHHGPMAKILPFPPVLFALATESGLAAADDVSLIQELLGRLRHSDGPTRRRATRAMIDLLDQLDGERIAHHA